MTVPRDFAFDLEARPRLPDVAGRERLRGYAVPSVPFRSGHMLAMRRFPASSIGPAYTSLWHRAPSVRLVIYQDQEPRFGCPRAFGPAIDEARVVPIELRWTGPHRFEMRIETDDVDLFWDVSLAGTAVTRVANLLSAVHLADFWLPQRGIFAVVDAFFEPHDPARHARALSRGEPSSGPGRTHDAGTTREQERFE